METIFDDTQNTYIRLQIVLTKKNTWFIWAAKLTVRAKYRKSFPKYLSFEVSGQSLLISLCHV